MASSPDAGTNQRQSATPSVAANAGWNAFATLWGIAVALLIAPVLIRSMGVERYGVLLLVWSVTGLLGLVNFGFGEATLRYIAHYFGRGSLPDVNRIMGSTLTFYLLVSLLISAVLLAAADWLVSAFKIAAEDQAEVAWLFRLSAIVFALKAFSQCYGAVPMALHRYDIASKVGILQSVVRSGGYIILALAGFGLIDIILWDLVTQAATVVAQSLIVRRIASGVSLLPSASMSGLREIIGFSVFSFLTYAFLMMHRESGKLLLGAQLGTAPVAYLGTPDNVSHRAHMIVASGSETLMPRFSSSSDKAAACTLLRDGTWSALVVSLVLLLPLATLMPHFLRLWIGPDFAIEAAAVGQLVALSYISQGAYAPAATYFRGTGKPWLVTIVVALAGLVTLSAAWILIPRYGLQGVGFAYLLGSIPAVAGTVHAWFHLLGKEARPTLMRLVILPVISACLALAVVLPVIANFPQPGWGLLLVLAAFLTTVVGGAVVIADLLVNRQDAPSRRALRSLLQSRKVGRLRAMALRLAKRSNPSSPSDR